MRFFKSPLSAVVLSMSLALPVCAAVVTTPTGVVTGEVSDPSAWDVWTRYSGVGGMAGITNAWPRSGNGSAQIGLDGGSSYSGWDYVKSGGLGRLDSVEAYSYDWYRASTSTVAQHFHPSMMLTLDIDGDLATTDDVGYLFFERAYNSEGLAAVPTDQWVTDTIGQATKLWFWDALNGPEYVYSRTLADYQAGTYTPTEGFQKVTGASIVTGITVSLGSGWDGKFDGAMDNPTFGTFTSNFELAAPPVVQATPVPVMGPLGLLGLSGALAAAAALARRQRNRKAGR